MGFHICGRSSLEMSCNDVNYVDTDLIREDVSSHRVARSQLFGNQIYKAI